MNIRSFGLRDLSLLPKYRNRGLFLDSTRMLIHGTIMVPMGALVSFVGPTLRIFSYYCRNNHREPVIAQVTYSIGSTYARISFIAPADGLDQAEVIGLTEYIVADIGQLGVFHILADVDESSPVFQLMHRAGFATYARQRIWRLDGEPQGEMNTAPWRPSRSRDAISVRSLYCNVVPGLVQQVEPLPQKDLKGVVYYQGSELSAFVEFKYGRKGIWVQPFVHPDTAGFDQHLAYLLHDLPVRRNRPLYICVRSYQSWLESAVEAMGAQPGPQQAVLVRHLAVSRRVNQPLPAINGKRVEPTAPMLRSEQGTVLKSTKMENKPG